jgi:HEAT repeat protein
MNKNKMDTSHVLFKMTIGIILAFCCVPVVGYSQLDEIHGLIQALEDKNVNIRRRAIRELEKAGPSAVEPLIAALKSEKSRARAGAAEALGEIKDSRAVEPLIAALQDKNPDVRSWAAKALGEIKDARAVEPIIAALQDKSAHVRSWAAEALGEIKDSRAVEPLIAVLEDENADVRNSAAKALAKIKPAT